MDVSSLINQVFGFQGLKVVSFFSCTDFQSISLKLQEDGWRRQPVRQPQGSSRVMQKHSGRWITTEQRC